MSNEAENEVLISVAPSAARRWMAVLSFIALGILTLRLAFEAVALWQLFFGLISLATFFAADQLRRATAGRIELTRDVLRTADGTILTTVENVRLVERGAFAFKPSNGFLVRLHAPVRKGWAPGLWWQRGKLLGIGGVLPGGQTRAMAELLTALKNDALPDPDG